MGGNYLFYGWQDRFFHLGFLHPFSKDILTGCSVYYHFIDVCLPYLSGCCIWKKQSLVLGRSPYQWQHEPVLFGWKKKGKHQWYTGRKESTIWEFDKPKKNSDHPTMKPIALLSYPIMNSTMTGCLVLDPFGGSGSTLIACEQTGRVCYTSELDEKFCDVIVNRYKEQVGSASTITCQRDGLTYTYEEIISQMEAENV